MRFKGNIIRKYEIERGMVDSGGLEEIYPQSWECMVDKGYQGIEEYLRILHPEKKPVNRILTVTEEEVFNAKISTDGIIFKMILDVCTQYGLFYQHSTDGRKHYIIP